MQAAYASPVSLENARYGGFWIRLVALIIDGILIGFVQILIIAPVLAAFGFAATAPENINPEDGAAAIAAMAGAMGMVQVISMIIGWLYFALMQSSSKQATIGKMALGLKVVDAEGNRLSFGKATLRYIGKIISGFILLIGYIIAAFSPRKQALHDMIAGTFVIKK